MDTKKYEVLEKTVELSSLCLLYTSDAADEARR